MVDDCLNVGDTLTLAAIPAKLGVLSTTQMSGDVTKSGECSTMTQWLMSGSAFSFIVHNFLSYHQVCHCHCSFFLMFFPCSRPHINTIITIFWEPGAERGQVIHLSLSKGDE